jgi:hypothetical protein
MFGMFAAATRHRNVAAPVVPFSPNDVADLQLWMEGESGLTTDLSDNAYTVANTAATISTADLNGLDTFRFTGSAWLDIGTQLGKPANFTIVAILKADNAATRQVAFASGAASGSSKFIWGSCIISQNSTPSKSISSHASDDVNFRQTSSSADALVNATYQLVTLRYTAGDAFTDMWVDAVATSQATAGSATSNTGVAEDFRLGSMGAHTSLNFTGNIAEHLVYDRALTQTEIDDIEAHLQSKYAL